MKKEQFGVEQQFVIDTFQEKFSSMKNREFVLYGIGKNTEAVLEGTNGFGFVGLMDAVATGSTLYGKKVLSDAEVIRIHPIIVIIAREPIVNIIYMRIQYLSEKYGISIYDFKGKLLTLENLTYMNDVLVDWSATEQELVSEIAEHEVISFDIFDTLLMRKVLHPEDVFHLVETL